MKKMILAACAAALLVAAPAGATSSASSHGKRHGSESESRCSDERRADRQAFALKYGTNHNHRNAWGRCVSSKSRSHDHADWQAWVSAAKACRTEYKADRQAFVDKYGTNHNRRNAFGKCVSQKAHEQQASQPTSGS
jgi:hypothetical protein